MTCVLDRSLEEIARALRSEETNAEELATIAIDRHTRLGDELNAYQVWDAECVLAEARAVDAATRAGFPLGPMGGIPVSVKDLYGVAGYPTYAGTPRQLPAEWESEGFLVSALRRQHAVFTGKTRMVELAFGGLGTNPHWGTPLNPWDAGVARVPGGSSCGAGVSLAEGSALIALGSDTACSIRTPAAMTGTVGQRLTLGRWPTTGVVPLSPTLDVVGGLARTVRDAAYFFAAIDPVQGDPEAFFAEHGSRQLGGLRIGIPQTAAWEDCPGDIAECVRRALSKLEARGALLVDLPMPEFDEAFDWYMSGKVVPPELLVFLDEHLPSCIDTVDETVRARMHAADTVTARAHLQAQERRRELSRLAAGRMQAVDILATPTVPLSPPAIADVEDPGDYARANRMTSRATNPVAVLDLCSLSMPCGMDDARLPVGLQLIGPRGGDERLLASALAAEHILGTAEEQFGLPPRGARGT